MFFPVQVPRLLAATGVTAPVAHPHSILMKITMRSLLRFAVASLCSAATFAPFAAVHAQARPSAADVLAKYVTAIGGKAELMKITSIKQSATANFPEMGMSGTMEMQTAAPNKLIQKMIIPNALDMQSGFDGSVGWQYSPQQGARLLADKELLESQSDADFYGDLLRPADRYSSMEFMADTTIENDRSYKLKLKNKATGVVSLEYFSAASGLLLLTVKPEGSQHVLEYKKFGAIMLPTKLNVQQGSTKLTISVKEVAFNSVPESAFAVPDQVKQLIKP